MQINGFPVERKKLEELTKAPYNPRKISPEMASALKRSLQEFGNVEPIIWNKQTGHIVGGHQRFDALLSIGETETDVVIVDMPEEREQALNIALNKISGDWNFGALSDILLSLHDDMRELTGFTEDEIAALLPKQEGLTDPNAIPEVVEPVAKLGDIWQLGEHRLMCGDSTDAGSVALLLNGDESISVLTDPPYGMDAVKNSGVLKERYRDVIGDADNTTAKKSFQLSLSLSKELVFWGANYYSDILPPSGCWLVWDKNNGQSDQADCELAWTSFGGVVRKFELASEKRNRVHPTQKPVALVEWVISKLKIENNILDLFLGSGSTLIACEQLNRKCYGIELDPHYCDVIIKRWEDFTGKKAVKVA